MPIKVNVDKLLADYNALSAKQDNKLAEIEVEARAYAAKRGFDEDAAKFNLLDEYIEEVDEPVADETTKAEDNATVQPTSPNVPNPAAVNVL